MKIRNHFSLVEILAVMVIIAILAGLGIGGYSYAMHVSRESATKSTIKRLETALEAMKAKYGFYPPGDGNVLKIVALDKLSVGANWPINGINNSTQNEKYMADFIKMMDLEVTSARELLKDTGDHYIFIDAWGNKFYYQCPGQINRSSFDLISAGADGYFTNAPGKLTVMPATYNQSHFSDSSGTTAVANCDDITNF